MCLINTFQIHCTLYCPNVRIQIIKLKQQNIHIILAGNGQRRLICCKAKHLPVPRGQRWSVNSSAWQWRRLCVLCWRRWHQTCWPASEDFAPKDRYLTPPSMCQPGKTKWHPLFNILNQGFPHVYLTASRYFCILFFIHTTSLGM